VFNISVSSVVSISNAASSSDEWGSFSTANGQMLRIGDGTYLSPSISSQANIIFAEKMAVQFTVYARWVLEGSDKFTLGYYDVSGYHELFFYYSAGSTRIFI
jgi:hypothetical protein